jgi:hypothetical protein
MAGFSLTDAKSGPTAYGPEAVEQESALIPEIQMKSKNARKQSIRFLRGSR